MKAQIMQTSKADIIAQLKKDLLTWGGFKKGVVGHQPDFGLSAIHAAFPDRTFPLGVVHEFVALGTPAATASRGFVAAIIGRLMKTGGAVLWIGPAKVVFPPALLIFGVKPDNIIFIDAKREKETLWVAEEALKCPGLAAVVTEVQELSLTSSRRLQLAVEQSKVTGFLIRVNPVGKNQTACFTRWNITPLPSAEQQHMPGVGFPRWKVTLEKVRNGKPGTWHMEWRAGRFRVLTDAAIVVQHDEQRQTG